MTTAEATSTEYRTALDGLWADTSRAITRLERIAGDPDRELCEAIDTLPVLQYALHRASEVAVGIVPPSGTAPAHREFAVALADARDLTGDVTALLDADEHEQAAGLAHEWRAMLFRVRLARRRLTRTEPLPLVEVEAPSDTRAAAASLALVVAGTAVFTTGAVLTLWPVWAVGLALVAAASFVYRP